MLKKKYPTRHPLLSHPAAVVASYVVFQGMLYMTPGERTFKLALTALLSAVLYAAGTPVLVALILGHLLNIAVNGQIAVLARYVAHGHGLTRARVLKTLEKIEATAPSFGVTEVLIFGSFCRHAMSPSSDLDVRVLHQPGMLRSILAYTFACFMRLWANLNHIPLDIYCYSDPKFLDKMRPDEIPALLFQASQPRQQFPAAMDARSALNLNKGLS